MTECLTNPFSRPTLLDDEIAALALQLEEIGLYHQFEKGKYAINNPPDFEIAFASFRAELQNYKTFLEDQQLACSIGAAVHFDGAILAELTSEEVRCREDRLLALQISTEDPEYQIPPGSVGECEHVGGRIPDWISAANESQYADSSVVDLSDDETLAGPSMSYAERQGGALEKFSKQFKCAICHEFFHSNLTISLPCTDRYCIGCLVALFVRATEDETLFPVRCHQQPIPLELVSKHMSANELAAFNLATIEFSTANRVYCSDRNCGQFIPPGRIESGTHRAQCERCSTITCALCGTGYHIGIDCPDDPALQETRELAREMGWQTCYRCRSIVVLRSGCNHMTCRCKAEFCYECGIEWKKCNCQHANPERMLERAEEIVDRDAAIDLPPVERQRMVQEVRAELDQNHECQHPGRFQRVFGGRRGGFRCEFCGDRHRKYILQCRRCFINVCEDCRRNRV